MTSDQEHQIGTHAAFAILAGLCALCVLASLSGCKMTFKTLPCECAQMDMR